MNSTVMKYLLFIFSCISIIDSIVYIVKANNDLSDFTTDFKYILIVFCIRIFICLVLLLLCVKQSILNEVLSIILMLIITILMTAILLISALLVKYKGDGIISIIIQTVITFLSLSLCYTTFQNNYVKNDNSKNTNKLIKVLKEIDKSIIAFATIFAVIIAASLASILDKTNHEEWTKQRSIIYIGFLGEMFFRVLKGLMIPLIFASLVTSIGGIDLKLSGKIGIRTFYYYITTTVVATIFGIIAVLLIRPGERTGNKEEIEREISYELTTEDTLLDLVRFAFINS